MTIGAKVAQHVRLLLGMMAEDVAKDYPVVQRQGKFTTVSLAQTCVLGFLFKPRAHDEELAQTATLRGVEVAPKPSSSGSPSRWRISSKRSSGGRFSTSSSHGSPWHPYSIGLPPC